MGQSSGEFEQRWDEERRTRITASNVGQISKHKPTTKVASNVKKLYFIQNFMIIGLQTGTCFKKMLAEQLT